MKRSWARWAAAVLVAMAGARFGAAEGSAAHVARIWRGHVRSADADAYQKYLDEQGIRKIRKIAGN
ncbi:MAG TPA: hypothetical protein VFL12_11950, partial [Thermoanaerobaculia bacterium]|nr:hypothetical protein [Thermoanaerobaculia bacterium]